MLMCAFSCAGTDSILSHLNYGSYRCDSEHKWWIKSHLDDFFFLNLVIALLTFIKRAVHFACLEAS